MNFGRFGPEWSLPSFHSSPTAVKGKTNHVKCVKTNIEIVFVKLRT